MSTPMNESGKVNGGVVVVDLIIIDILPADPTVDVNDTDLWGQPIDTSLYAQIAPECKDEELMKAIDNWADNVELWQAYPGIPYPGPNGAWVGLLTNVVPSGSECVKFPKELGAKLKPWIPDSLYDSVVAK